MAQMFLLPFRPALDANAIVVPGAKLYFYVTGTTTPQAVYADEGLVTPLANPLEADAAGAWPAIYLDATKTYRVVLKDAAGATLPNGDIDPYIPGDVDGITTTLVDNGATLIKVIDDATGAVERSIQSQTRDFKSLKGFGAVGDGVTSDNTAFTSADSYSGPVFVPPGTYKTSTAASAMRGPFWGPGRIKDSADKLRAPYFSAISSPPSSFGNWDGPDDAFSGDISQMQRVSEHRIYGATTLGQPTSGYTLRRETAAEFLYTYVHSDAGHNQGTSSNNGRTGAIGWGRQMFHAGNGDGILYWGQIIATGTKSGSTHWLANPAAAFFGGDVFGGASGVYLQGIGDLNFHDNGNDVACQGLTFNFHRSNKTGAKSADWTGIRLQTQSTEAVNAWAAFVGKADLGFDFTKSDFGTNQGAIVTAPNQRYYGNGSNSDSNSLSRFTSLGDAYFTYSSSLSAWNFVVSNTSVLQMGAGQISALFAIKQRVYTVATLPTPVVGLECYVSDANATTRLSVVAGGGGNTVKVYYNGTNWVIQ